jgi:meso-butanediol dehydrogenase/(S,S)-butanediol dehydrogenase/diacetyl reductase
MRRFEQRVAVITGAARGIGRAVAARLLEEGARVAITDIDEELGRRTAETLGSNCLFVKCDHTISAECAEVAHIVAKRWGGIDILHNNAAISCKRKFEDVGDLELNRVMQANLLGPWYMTRELLPALKESAAKRPDTGSVLLFTASGLSFHAAPLISAYTTAKHGIIGLVRSLAIDLGPHNIRVNAICPGIVPTEKLRTSTTAWGDPLEVLEQYRQKTPLQRLAQPEDIAAAAAFLASDDARSISAQAILVNGGSDAH